MLSEIIAMLYIYYLLLVYNVVLPVDTDHPIVGHGERIQGGVT